MVVATSAQTEPAGLSPENEIDPPSPMTSEIMPNGDNSATKILKPSPKRPTSLVISASSSSHHRSSRAPLRSASQASAKPAVNNGNIDSNSHQRKSAFSAYSNQTTTFTRNGQQRSSHSAAIMSYSSQNNNATAERPSSSAAFVSDSKGVVNKKSADASGNSSSAKQPGVEDLEYASVTYRYLKEMDAKKSKPKAPSYARSMISLNDNKTSSRPDDSIVSVPCPQPSSACPTPAAIRSSLRRRHSDLNLSSIANFLRTRFSRHDDTIDPKQAAEKTSISGGDSLDEIIQKAKFNRPNRSVSQRGSSTGSSIGGSSNNENHASTASKPSHSRPPCSNCSNPNSASYRRPCFRCRNRLIDVILESDATEV